MNMIPSLPDLSQASEDEMDRAIRRQQSLNASRVSGSSLDENVRLLLQYMTDHGGGGTPTELNGSQRRGCELGLLTRHVPKGSGIVTYEITKGGYAALAAANAELGSQATRMVRRLMDFGDGEPVVYGYPFQVPMTQRVRRVDDCLVIEDRTLLQRLFG